MAKQLSTHSTEFGRKIATVSPAAMPLSARCAGKFSGSLVERGVSHRRCARRDRRTLSPCAAACRRSNSGMGAIRSVRSMRVPSSNHAEAAADAEHLPGDPAGMRRGQQRHHRRDVARQAKAAQRIKLDQLFAVGVDPFLVVRRFNKPQRYGICRRAGAAELARQRLHQRDHAGARRGDDRQARIRRRARNRR